MQPIKLTSFQLLIGAGGMGSSWACPSASVCKNFAGQPLSFACVHSSTGFGGAAWCGGERGRASLCVRSSALANPIPLLACTTSQVLEVRHGAVVGVAELLPALKDAGLELPKELQEKVR